MTIIHSFFRYLLKHEYIMNIIKNFGMMIDRLKEHKIKKRVAVVFGVDSHSEFALSNAIKAGFINVIMIGPKKEVESYPIFKEHPESVEFIDMDDPDSAAIKAVSLIHEKKADILMKGIINTDNLLRVVLNKEKGLLPKGKVLTHLSIAEIPSLSKLLFFLDAAVIPYPTLDQRREMLGYMSKACRSFGIVTPKLALIHCTEKVSNKFPHSLDYVQLIDDAKDGLFGSSVVDGPMDICTACDKESGEIKGIESPIGGDADGLMFPNIESGNVFYKSITLFGHAQMAGILMGTECPVIITSRSDSGLTKFNSIAMACLTH